MVVGSTATSATVSAGDRLRARAAEYRAKGYDTLALQYERQAAEADAEDATWQAVMDGGKS